MDIRTAQKLMIAFHRQRRAQEEAEMRERAAKYYARLTLRMS